MSSDRSMELLRDELLRRARGDGHVDAAEDQNHILASRRRTMLREMQTDMQTDTGRRFPRRLLLPRLALGRRGGALGDEEEGLESPKTPLLPSRGAPSYTPEGLQAPQPAVLAASVNGNPRPESMAPPYTETQRQADKREKSKRFLFCFPFIKSRHVRVQIAQCFVAAVFLFSLLAVCKWSFYYFFSIAFCCWASLENANMRHRFGYNSIKACRHRRIEYHVDYDHSPGGSLLLLQPHPAMDSYSSRGPSGPGT
jgi:hypothetical protein